MRSISLKFCVCVYALQNLDRNFAHLVNFAHPASLTIISCKYENRHRLQFTIEFAKNKQQQQQQQQHEK